MKKVYLLVAVLLLGLGAYFGWRAYNNRPIEEGELPTAQNTNCRNIDPALVERCDRAGGVLKNEQVGLGLGPTYTFGCYPDEKASDGGKVCGHDFDCQGECSAHRGDIVIGPPAVKRCSDFKKPFFTYIKYKDVGFCFGVSVPGNR